jgi:hypothetical protein
LDREILAFLAFAFEVLVVQLVLSVLRARRFTFLADASRVAMSRLLAWLNLRGGVRRVATKVARGMPCGEGRGG